jgi:hypothetical protein
MVFGWARWTVKKLRGAGKDKKTKKRLFEIEDKLYIAEDETGEFVNKNNPHDRIPYYVMGYAPEIKAEEKLKEVV